MHKSLHSTHGLDHKCRTCGQGLAQHTDDMVCPSDFPTSEGSMTHYNPKGPRLPAELWALLLRMEDAAIMLHLVSNPAMLRASESEMKQRKQEYKDARFALNSYLAERLGKLEGYECVRELRSVPLPRK